MGKLTEIGETGCVLKFKYGFDYCCCRTVLYKWASLNFKLTYCLIGKELLKLSSTANFIAVRTFLPRISVCSMRNLLPRKNGLH